MRRAGAVKHLAWPRLVAPYRGLLTVAFVAMLCQAAADLLEPWPLKVIFDNVIGSRPVPHWLARWPGIAATPLALLNAAAIAVVAIAIAGAVSSYAEKYLATTVGQRVLHDLRGVLYHHVQRLSLAFHEQRTTGDMVVRLTTDLDAVQDFISSALLGVTFDVLSLAAMLGMMLYLDWRFTLVSLSVTPVLFVVVYRLTRRIKAAARDVKRKEADVASVVQETISSARVVKAFASERYEELRLDRESREGVALALRARSIKARLSPAVDVIVAIGTCVTLLVGARLVLAGRLSAGSLLVFVLYLGKMYKPMRDLSKMTDTWSKAGVAFERVEELLATESQVKEQPDARPAPRFVGRIAFEHVRFGYRADQPVLRDVSLTIEPGQAAAVVGATGGGKSTLIALIPRLYDVSGGRILIDGRDVRDYTLQSLRDQVSFVLQDAVLFRTSIWQNIAYGRPDARRADIIAAARLANADEFIERMPEGYDTVVGERGETLSAGQRQRIAIARAVIRRSPILLMDEPSAMLDSQSERLVFEALERLMEGRTSLTIAHRLGTIRHADVIFVLAEGVIAERGTHDELLAKGGLYAGFCNAQLVPTS
jgi:subfamily B ATP-binding cassette protein MsbA